MMTIKESELMDRYIAVHKELDTIRNRSIAVRKNIFNPNSNRLSDEFQMTIDKEWIQKELDMIGIDLSSIYYTIKKLCTMTNRMIESLPKDSKQTIDLDMVMNQTVSKFRSACKRHEANLEYAADLLNVSSNTFAIA